MELLEECQAAKGFLKRPKAVKTLNWVDIRVGKYPEILLKCITVSWF